MGVKDLFELLCALRASVGASIITNILEITVPYSTIDQYERPETWSLWLRSFDTGTQGPTGWLHGPQTGDAVGAQECLAPQGPTIKELEPFRSP